MGVLTERKGTRKFERLSKWHILSDTNITRNSSNAKYASDTNRNSDKLILTYFKLDTVIYPIGRFEKLSSPIMLSDLSRIVMKDTESNLMLEMNETKNKVRIYQEVQ